jgi:hypothetical protein
VIEHPDRVIEALCSPMGRAPDDIPSDGAIYAAHSRSLLTDAQNAAIDAEMDRKIALVVAEVEVEAQVRRMPPPSWWRRLLAVLGCLPVTPRNVTGRPWPVSVAKVGNGQVAATPKPVAASGAAARQADAARTFLTLLTSPAAVELFKAKGFEPASR